MPIVTLTSDFGSRDYYLPLLKGAILSKNDQINLVDITHDLPSYDIVHASFIFRNAWRSFPKGTIHVVSVNDFYDRECHFVALRHEEQYFIGPDNGLFSLVFGEMPREIYRLDDPKRGDFPLKDIYADAVGHLANGYPYHEIGEPMREIVQRITFQPVITGSQIRGSVIHIDRFDNVILNITRERFEQVGQNRPFRLFFKRHDPITRLSRQYHDVPVGEVLCLVNSAGYLEIAINMGRAATLLGLKLEDSVQVDFELG